MGETRPVFSKDSMPGDLDVAGGWYRKRVLTWAFRVDGPFAVQTSEGLLRCDDGWLAMDARGYPYPIATEEFALIYEEADLREAEDV